MGIELEEWDEMPAMISPAQSELLSQPVTQEEVRKVVFDINPSKYPGSDGMSGFFFQQFWETSKEEITGMVQNFFETGVLEEGMNNTNIFSSRKS